MDYITKYYKTLSEDLSIRLETLQKFITEMEGAHISSGEMAAAAPPMDWSDSSQHAQPNTTPPVMHEYVPGQPHFPISGDGSRYPNGRQDPSYHEDYFEYLKWYRQQPKDYQKRNPMPPPMPPLPIKRRENPSRGSGAPGGPRR
jgi:hypothetical protein